MANNSLRITIVNNVRRWRLLLLRNTTRVWKMEIEIQKKYRTNLKVRNYIRFRKFRWLSSYFKGFDSFQMFICYSVGTFTFPKNYYGYTEQANCEGSKVHNGWNLSSENSCKNGLVNSFTLFNCLCDGCFAIHNGMAVTYDSNREQNLGPVSKEDVLPCELWSSFFHGYQWVDV